MQMQSAEDIPMIQKIKGSINNRRNSYKSSSDTPDRLRGSRPILRKTKPKKMNSIRPNPGSPGLTTIDRRPGRPTFHHMGPLPDKPATVVQQSESNTRVRDFNQI